MKILKITFLWFLFVASAQSADTGLFVGDQEALPLLAAARRDSPQYVFEMGFELETNGIKVRHPDEDTILILMQSEDGKWQLTTDTHDEKIEKAGWVNLECRTCGGLNQAKILHHKDITQQILRHIKQACDIAPDGQLLLPIIPNHPFGIESLRIGEEMKEEPTFCTKKSIVGELGVGYQVLECVLRPQLSFSFPMSQMRPVFGLLARYETTTPRVLLAREEVISDEPLKLPIQRKIAERKKIVNQFVQTGALGFLQDHQEQSGFCLLFLSYVFDLFILNNEVTALNETGPKGFLKVVSRVSFSDMYAQLSEEERGLFEHFYPRFLSQFEARKIKPYRRDTPALCCDEPLTAPAIKYSFIVEEERITLRDWVTSIHRPIQRRGQTRACDLLAPPPHTAQDYSMGAVEIKDISPSHALIEARGYANLELGNQKITIDNFTTLIDSESGFFFALGDEFKGH